MASSIVFKLPNETALLVITSGRHRLDTKLVATALGVEKLHRADADFVRQHAGFSIGGVPPVGHLEPLLTFIDQDLLQYSEIWAAAGTPNAVFRLSPADLARMTGGEVVRIT